MDVPAERPTIICLVALPGKINSARPVAFELIDILEFPKWSRNGWICVAVDPDTHEAFTRWRAANPNAR